MVSSANRGAIKFNPSNGPTQIQQLTEEELDVMCIQVPVDEYFPHNRRVREGEENQAQTVTRLHGGAMRINAVKTKTESCEVKVLMLTTKSRVRK